MTTNPEETADTPGLVPIGHPLKLEPEAYTTGRRLFILELLSLIVSVAGADSTSSR